MPEIHQVGYFKGGDKEPTAGNPIYATWKAAAQDGKYIPDLSAFLSEEAAKRRATIGSGEALGTCFAMLEHFDASRSMLMYKIGSSRLKLNLEEAYYKTTTGKTVGTLVGHAEISALAQAINSVALPDNDYTFFVTRLYIELSPCNLCAPQLEPYIVNTVLMYAHKYETELDNWSGDNLAGVHALTGQTKKSLKPDNF